MQASILPESCCMAPKGQSQQTLRQKDRIGTILWRAMVHRRSKIFQVKKTEEYLYQNFCYGCAFMYVIGISYHIHKDAPQDAHSREEEVCRKRPRSARECAMAHSLFKNHARRDVYENRH